MVPQGRSPDFPVFQVSPLTPFSVDGVGEADVGVVQEPARLPRRTGRWIGATSGRTTTSTTASSR